MDSVSGKVSLETKTVFTRKEVNKKETRFLAKFFVNCFPALSMGWM